MKTPKIILQIRRSRDYAKKLWSQDRFSFLLLASIYVFEFAFMLSVPTLSGLAKWHNIPLVLCAIQCALMLVWVLTKNRFFIDFPIVFIFLFPLYAALSSVWGWYDSQNLTLLLLALLAAAIYEFLVVSKQTVQYIAVWGAALVSFGLIYLFCYRQAIFSLSFTRIGDLFNNVNNIATFFSIGVAFSCALLARKQWWALAFLGFFAVLGVTTGSRTFFVAMALSLIATIPMIFGKKRWYFSLLAFLGLIGAGVVLLQLPLFATIRSRLSTLFFSFSGSSIDGSTQERVMMAVEGATLWLRQPFFGNGHNAFRYLSHFSTYSHNTLIEVLCNYGLFGATIFFAPLGIFINGIIPVKNGKKKNPLFFAIGVLLIILLFNELMSGVATAEKNHYLILSLLLVFSRDGKIPQQFMLIEAGVKHDDRSVWLAKRSPKRDASLLTDWYHI